jgi:6-phosphofructokinase 1
MRIGVLTGGGDAPGLNPAIKGLVYRGSELGLEVIGLLDGWRSLLNPAPEVLPLDRETVRRWDRDGGTNLGSSRTNPFKQLTEEGETHDRSDEVVENIERLQLDFDRVVMVHAPNPDRPVTRNDLLGPGKGTN